MHRSHSKPMLKRLLSPETDGAGSSGGSPPANPTLPGSPPATKGPNELAGTTNQMVHILQPYTAEQQLRILGALTTIMGIKLP